MAFPFKDQRLLLLAATTMAVISAVLLIANVRMASGQGVEVDKSLLDELTSVITQIMVAFWVVLIGYLGYRYLNQRRIEKLRTGLKAGRGQSLLPYAIILLVLWLVIFFLRPFDPGGILNGQQGTGNGEGNVTGPPPVTTSQNLPLVLPLVVVLLAFASFVIVWRFLRQNPSPAPAVTQGRREQAMEVIDRAVSSLYAGEDPRSTIIRTYQRMCLLVQTGKIEEEPYLTPREFADRAVSELGWSAAPLQDLTSIFEEARYSDHVMGGPQVARAIASFERLRQDLEVVPDGGTAQ
jgi:hypothetical protein